MYKTKSVVFVLVGSEYDFTVNTNKINMAHIDDNLASGHRNSPPGRRIREKQPKQREQERSDMLWLLLLYSSIRYTNNNTHQNGCRKTHVHTRLLKRRRGVIGTGRFGLCSGSVGLPTRWGPLPCTLASASVFCSRMQRCQCCCILLSAYIKLSGAVKTSGLPLLRAFVKWAVGLLLPLLPRSVPWSSTASGLLLPQSFFIALLGIRGPSLVGQYQVMQNAGLLNKFQLQLLVFFPFLTDPAHLFD